MLSSENYDREEIFATRGDYMNDYETLIRLKKYGIRKSLW